MMSGKGDTKVDPRIPSLKVEVERRRINKNFKIEEALKKTEDFHITPFEKICTSYVTLEL